MTTPERATASPLASYGALAGEYYDRERHPTCASFREASENLLERLLPASAPGSHEMIEVGCGASLLAPWLTARGLPLQGVLLTDDSAEMLEHSRRWGDRGASLAVAPASALPVADGSIRLFVASLADPYDDDSLWAEVRRVLAPGGAAIVTTPSWTWASRFRGDGEPLDRARFLLASGVELEVPSHVRPVAAERELIESHGLSVNALENVRLEELAQPAPKLELLDPAEPVATGYTVGG